MKRKKILIGCCGGFSGIYLAKQFARFIDFEILGFDSNPDSAAIFFCEKIFVLPKITDDVFLDKLINLLNNEKIDFYIPTYSKELLIIAKNQELFLNNTKTKCIISSYKTYQLLNDKLTANRSLKEIGIPVPKIFQNKEECVFPIIIKPSIGSGSLGLIKINNKTELNQYVANENDIMMEYLEGDEYTVDCLFDESCKLLGYNQRKRIKSLHGAVIITENDNSFDIFPFLSKIIESYEFKGCVNFQYILKNKIPYFIDINLRFAAGGLPLSVESGLDVPLALRKMFLGETIKTDEFKSDFKKRTMYRYFEEKFITK